MKKISVVFGTRPEAIKLAPVILELKKIPGIRVHVCVTGQHREMLNQVLALFNIKPNINLDLMQQNQTLASFTSRAIGTLSNYFCKFKPNIILVQGDTTTVFCASLAAFYNRIPVGHVEAGLRTWDKYSPYPEEINRVLTTHLSDIHFAPTIASKKNLLKENVTESNIFVTGNTVIDALMLVLDKVRKKPPLIPNLNKFIFRYKDMVLITGHRRESFGEGIKNICNAISQLADKFPTVAFVYPVHMNPNVRKPVFKFLTDKTNVLLLEPIDYSCFVYLMDKSKIILTDSGGVQEEAPSLGKPVLVMRDTTERPEGVQAGIVRIVGTKCKNIVETVSLLLTNATIYKSMSHVDNPYGDGKAANRIVSILLKKLCRGS